MRAVKIIFRVAMTLLMVAPLACGGGSGKPGGTAGAGGGGGTGTAGATGGAGGAGASGTAGADGGAGASGTAGADAAAVADGGDAAAGADAPSDVASEHASTDAAEVGTDAGLVESWQIHPFPLCQSSKNVICIDLGTAGYQIAFTGPCDTGTAGTPQRNSSIYLWLSAKPAAGTLTVKSASMLTDTTTVPASQVVIEETRFEDANTLQAFWAKSGSATVVAEGATGFHLTFTGVTSTTSNAAMTAADLDGDLHCQ
jgi:hypothetical protein